ncbi:hypothetical protein [Cohnella zeiphila]|uniref:Ferric oxidoreductase domain-containing protein n=1 Tax=Cohnella zeiphila TaxID=2761120 RepID=A0A7X0SGB6_9BACL|nr:hypothetical protein [Cohnella zeiphila]MBB6729451.1 hypothetical protein [Cohnella zeiphila]
MNEKKPAARQSWIPAKERKWVFAFLALAFVLVAYGLWKMLYDVSTGWHSPPFKESFQSYGSVARILLFAVLALYPFMLAMKKRMFDRWTGVKKMAIRLLKWVRHFHAPLAIAAIGLIALHVVGALLYGIRFDFTDVSGLAAAAVLIGVPVAGIFRYRRLDRKWHLRLGLLFGALFLIHAFL